MEVCSQVLHLNKNKRNSHQWTSTQRKVFDPTSKDWHHNIFYTFRNNKGLRCSWNSLLCFSALMGLSNLVIVEKLLLSLQIINSRKPCNDHIVWNKFFLFFCRCHFTLKCFSLWYVFIFQGWIQFLELVECQLKHFCE